jgi:hypothetical protein
MAGNNYLLLDQNLKKPFYFFEGRSEGQMVIDSEDSRPGGPFAPIPWQSA